MKDKQAIPTPQKRRLRRHQEMRTVIMDVAREMMRTDGAGALSWNGIARRVGLKPPSLYVYFDDKMALYDALFREGWEQHAATMERAFAEASGGWDAVREVTEAHVQFCLDNPDLFQIMFQRPIPGFEPSPESLKVSFGSLERSRQQFAQMLEQEEIDPGMPAAKACDLWIATIHGVTAQHLANEPELPLGEGRFGSLLPAVMDLFKAAWERNPNVRKPNGG